MICPYCKNSLQDASGVVVVCPYCGSRIVLQNYPQPPQYYPGVCSGTGCAERITMFTALKKYAQFEGRASRSEYWLWVLFTTIVQLIFLGSFGVAVCLVPESEIMWVLGIFMILFIIFCMATIVPSLAVQVRRLHDTGKAGWWVLLPMLPFVGGICSIILLVFYCMDSEYGPNQYGPNPKGIGNNF